MWQQFKNYINLMRVNHYIKNFLIFLPLFFGGLYTDISKVIICLIGFIVFSLASSIIYIINDINDIEKDRLHAVKKNRPLASGKVTIKEAYMLIFILAISLLLTSFYLCYLGVNPWVLSLVLFYMILNVLYSKGLKNIVFVDVICIVLGFLIRIFFGAFLVDVIISNWLYLTVMSGAFYMGFGKRRNEIIKSKNSTREVLKYYNKDFLDKSMYVCLTLTIVFYSMWTVDPDVISRINNEFLIWTVPLIMIILFQYSLAVEKDSFGDPVDVILNNKSILITLIIYVLVLTIIWI